MSRQDKLNAILKIQTAIETAQDVLNQVYQIIDDGFDNIPRIPIDDPTNLGETEFESVHPELTDEYLRTLSRIETIDEILEKQIKASHDIFEW